MLNFTYDQLYNLYTQYIEYITYVNYKMHKRRDENYWFCIYISSMHDELSWSKLTLEYISSSFSAK